MRGVFSRHVVTPEEQHLALVRDLADKPDVWMAERVYQGAVQELKEYWDESILGVASNSKETVVAKVNELEGQLLSDMGRPKEKEEDDSDGGGGGEDVAENNNDSGIVSNTATDECDKDGHDILPPACELLRKILSTEAERRADLTVKLKNWIKGQENLLVGSEGATRFAWMDLDGEKSGTEEDDTREEGTKSIDGSVPSDQEKTKERIEADVTDDKLAVNKGNASTKSLLPTLKPATLKERRIQVLKQVERTLSEKYSKTVARDWLQSKRDASETLNVMEEIFGVESYLESPHVVSAAIGEWWEIKRPSTDEDSIDGRIEEPEYHLALVIISSGPQMHLFDMDAKVDFVHLETPPQDALMELLSGKSFPDPVLSIQMSDAQVDMTEEVGTLEIFPNDPSVPCIRLVSPHLNNVS